MSARDALYGRRGGRWVEGDPTKRLAELRDLFAEHAASQADAEADPAAEQLGLFDG